jgi:hypothetical protein
MTRLNQLRTSGEFSVLVDDRHAPAIGSVLRVLKVGVVLLSLTRVVISTTTMKVPATGARLSGMISNCVQFAEGEPCD